MRRIFTEYLRSLDPHGDPPEPRVFGELWEALRRALRSELRKRGLWDSPPSYLGIFGWPRWSAPHPCEERRSVGLRSKEDALEELLAECYVFIFVTRLQSLKAHLKVKPNIDGLIFLNLRHFLYDRQQEYDPLGTRVFEMLQAAVRRLIATGEVHVLAGDSKIRNDTLLGFAPDADPQRAPAPELRQLVESWNDDLLPELVTARGKSQLETIARLCRHFAELRSAGVEAVRFRDVIDVLKRDVRLRWAAILDRLEGETALEDSDNELTSIVRLVHPETPFEEQESFQRLAACVTDAVERLEVNEKAKGYLSTLWQFLRTYAAEPSASESSARKAPDPKEHELPSRRKIALLLGIPRDRLPGLYETLGELIRECQAICRSAMGRSPAAGEARAGPSASEGRSL